MVRKMEFMATTTHGLEDVAAEELGDLGVAEIIRIGHGRIEFKGALEALYTINLVARCVGVSDPSQGGCLES